MIFSNRNKKTLIFYTLFELKPLFFFKKGQSLVEALIVSLGLIAVTKIILVLFWIFVSLIWMEHQLYQGLICSAQQRNHRDCEQKVLNQIRRLNRLGKIQSVKIKEFKQEWRGEIQWIFYEKVFFIKQSLSLYSSDLNFEFSERKKITFINF